MTVLVVGCDRPSHEHAGGDFTVTDDLGRTVRLDSVPQRIVSLAPSLTEALFAVGAGEQVVGVTRSCNFPEDVRTLPVVGDILHPDIERVLELRPDLVLLSVEGNTQKSFAALERVGLRLFVSNPRSLEGVCTSLLDLGRITGHTDRAHVFVDSLRRMREALRAQAFIHQSGVLLLISSQPLMAAGESTFLNEIIALAGGRNCAAGIPGHYPTLNRETVLEMNPDMLVFPDDLHVRRETLLERYPEWIHVRAVQAGCVHALDADILLRPGPRVFLAAQQLRELLRAAGQDS
ncbi:MAG: cobalamin-binding protein [Bacteroidetes bacterium]|nr:cobalamin-binding protein [Bacteroidota bacterium]